jgi:type I restriction enzyme R subunit
VLWDDNGKPLALIEAKRTTKDIEVKHQAFLYANCLEQMHGQRPVIFYTMAMKPNYGMINSTVLQKSAWFYTKEELQWLICGKEQR